MANQPRVTRLRRAALLAFGAFFPLSWLVGGSAAVALPIVSPAVVGPQSVTVSDKTEAWYASLPLPIDLCATPLGCLSVPVPLPSLYPADTLHVGVALGAETARSYVRPDLHSVPTGAKVVQATMTLPVAGALTDGSLSPQSAKLIACVATQPFDDGTNGALTVAPRVDCHGAPKLKYDAKRSVFTVDVTKIVARWVTGSPENGIAILPDVADASPLGLWHVTLDGHKRAGSPHIKTAVTFTVESADKPDETATPTPGPVATDVAPPVILPPDEGVVPPAEPAPVIAPTAARPVAFVKHFQYPMAFLFPIALLAVGVFLMRLFTRDAAPVKQR